MMPLGPCQGDGLQEHGSCYQPVFYFFQDSKLMGPPQTVASVSAFCTVLRTSRIITVIYLFTWRLSYLFFFYFVDFAHSLSSSVINSIVGCWEEVKSMSREIAFLWKLWIVNLFLIKHSVRISTSGNFSFHRVLICVMYSKRKLGKSL